jgi:biopolymer transport protein ExbD
MRRFVPAAPNHAPIDGINITPLIDVMLVLLVMFIITLPATMHQIPIDLPQPAPDKALPRAIHRLEIARGGAVALDGAGVSQAALAARLGTLAQDPQAMLVMKTDPQARYDAFAQTTATVKRAGITRLGFEGNAGMVE